jgi:PhzF family phenazine biosynthesis protein
VRVPLFQIDAFAARRFEGNPAAVMLLDDYPDDAVLQSVAAENNLAETAFLVPAGSGYRLRWFTPTVEVPLCGHATLASAAVVMERLDPQRTQVVFQTASGPLTVNRVGPGYVMDLPARSSRPIEPPDGLTEALGVTPMEVVAHALDYVALLADADVVRKLTPNIAAIGALDRNGVIVTAPGDGGYDFVSRYFAPAKGIPEDPVTGGAHCTLTPFWAARLGKDELLAYQASNRGGEIGCQLVGDRVRLTGSCVFYLQGEAEIDGSQPDSWSH